MQQQRVLRIDSRIAAMALAGWHIALPSAAAFANHSMLRLAKLRRGCSAVCTLFRDLSPRLSDA
jgi:hypothetical protein